MLPAVVLLSQELAVVLAAVAVGTSWGSTGICSRLSTVSSSLAGGIEISGFASVEVSIAGDSAASTVANSGTDGSGCNVGGCATSFGFATGIGL